MKPYYEKNGISVYHGDCLDILRSMPDATVQCCVTSPPYWGLRDYGMEGQLGLENTPQEYVVKMTEVFREVRRVLSDDGTLWLNLGDSYAGSWGNYGASGPGKQRDKSSERWTRGAYDGHEDWRPPTSNDLPGLKSKDLIGIPWRVAFALQADGWYLRSDIIWAKPNPMPESVTDRPTKSHEYIFLMSKSRQYYYDLEAIREEPKPDNAGMMRAPKCGADRPGYDTLADESGNVTVKQYDEVKGANRRTVWSIQTQPFAKAHFAVFPEALPELCIKAGCPEGGTVLDPFAGSGTTLKVSRDLGCKAIGIELNEEYIEIIKGRIEQDVFAF